MTRFFFWLNTACLVLLCSQTHAIAVAGHVIMVKGDVIARDDQGQQRPLSRRDPVYDSDTILTGDDSRLQIRFIDKGLLALKANSELSIRSYRQPDPDQQDDGDILMKLVEGGFRTLTGTIGKGNKEAYKVETPVGSIGIRGTMYSVWFSNRELLAGVWNGGIQLDGPQGSTSLGDGADYDFGRFTGTGFEGLLTPPAQLETASTAATPLTAEKAQDKQSALAEPATPALDNSDGASHLPQPLPNPIDKEPDAATQTTLIGNGQMDSLQYGQLISSAGNQPSGVMYDGSEQPVFTQQQLSGLTLTRFDGPADPSVTPPALANVNWGIWNGSAEQPIRQYNSDGQLINEIHEPLLWLTANPATSLDVFGINGSLSFYSEGGAQPGLINGEAVNDLTVFGGFDVNLANGRVNDGNLTAAYGDDYWYARFAGQLNSTGSDFQITGGNHGEATLNLDQSTITGILVAPQQPGSVPGFAGGFQLIDQLDNSAAGLFAWPGQINSGLPTSDNPEPQR